MLKKVLIALGASLGLLLIVGLWLPSEYTVERTIGVDRPAATVYALLNGFAYFQQWSPWATRDPEAEYVLTGPEAGPGARIAWNGDPRLVGTGWLEIVRSQPYQRIDMHLDFGTQLAARSHFVVIRATPGVELTWAFTADVTSGQGFFGGIINRYLGLFLDQWLGPELESGLARFKQLAETLPASPFDEAGIAVIEASPQPILFVSGSSSQASEDVAAALAEAFLELSAFLKDRGISRSGQPMAITRAWDENGFQFDAAVPVDAAVPALQGRLQNGFSPGGKAARIIHRGGYETILESYEKLAAYMAAHRLQEGGLSWEHYISDPAETPTHELETHIYVQLQD